MRATQPMSRDIEVLPHGGRRGGLIAFVAKALATLFTWRERSRQRRHLQELDERLLRDIGLSPDDVRRESVNPAWRN